MEYFLIYREKNNRNSSKLRYNIFQMKIFFTFLFLVILSPFAYADGPPIFVIGQEVQSIHDYMEATKRNADQPDGFMVYTAINDIRGLWEPVDQGAGINYADQLLKEYPKISVIQIGLYMRYMLKETLNGSFDKTIDQLGEWIKKTDKQVYLRIGYEFDNLENQYNPEDYKQAYRYIVDRLRSRDISNIDFVWHTIAWRDKDWPAYDPLKWYPGDEYIDWVGISFFDSKQDKERIKAAEIAHQINKPLMIAESSPFFQYTNDEKLEWMNKLFEYMKTYRVNFLSYINVNWDHLPMFKNQKWGDSRLQIEPVIMSKWLEEIKEFKR